MRICYVTTYYPSYLRQFYRARPALRNRNYNDIHAALMDDRFAWSDSWIDALRPLDYEGMVVVANDSHLQSAWARENGFARKGIPLLEISQEQVRTFKPEVLFVDDYVTFSGDWIRELRATVPTLRLVVGWCGAPYDDDRVFSTMNIVLSCIPELVAGFRKNGLRSERLAHAFDERVLERLQPSPHEMDITFVGSISRWSNYHLGREAMLAEIARHLPIQIYTPGADATVAERASLRLKGLLYDLLDGLDRLGVERNAFRNIPIFGTAARWTRRPEAPISEAIRPFARSAVYGMEMYRVLQKSKIALNSHIDVSAAGATNMRLFEATGIGTCLLTDSKSDLSRYFVPDQEVATYRSPGECLEKARWYLDHPQERAEVARRGQARTLRDHTFSRRAIELDELIQRELRR